MTTPILSKALKAESADEAARIVQDALGITDGSIASMFFEPAEWPTLPRYKRRRVMAEWLRAEINYAE